MSTLEVYKKSNGKIKSLSRAAKCMCSDERRLIMNTFFSAQFSYYSITWMFYNRFLN